MILKINGAQISLPKGSVKITYAVNDVANPGKRDGAYSDTFDIPKTNEYSRILGYPDDLNIFDEDVNPYKKLPCEIWDGNTILKGFAIIQGTEKSFKVNVFGDNVNWFDLVSDAKITDINLDEYTHTYNETNILSAYSNIAGYVYPVIDYDNQFKDRVLNGFADDIVLDEIFPAVYVHTILKKIFRAAGYKLSGDFINDPIYKKLVIPFSNKEFITINGRDFKALPTVARPYSVTATTGTVPLAAPYRAKLTFDNDSELPGFHEGIDNWDNVTGRYTSDISTIIKVSLKPSYTESPVGGVKFRIVKNGDPASLGVHIAAGVTYELNLPVVPGDYIEVWIGAESIPGTVHSIILEPTSFVQIVDLTPTHANSKVRLVDNLPDVTQGELITTLFNQFQIITTTDEYTKTVYFNYFKMIAARTPQAEDWSAKLDVSDPAEIEFAIDGYGIKNNFKYAESTDEQEMVDFNNGNEVKYGDGQEIFNNETLEAEKDIFESAFSATIVHEAFTGTSGQYVDLPTIAKGSNPRIMIYAGRVELFDISNQSSIFFINATTNHIPYAYFDKPQVSGDFELVRDSLSFSRPEGYSTTPLLTKYFPAVKRMVERPKKLIANFLLKNVDILNLNFLLPKYIAKYNSYFYLSTVNEYSGEDQLTECELIKLQPPQIPGSDIPGSILLEDGFSILTEDGEAFTLE